MDVWVLAGQSNMQGCAPLLNALEPRDDVFCFTSGGAWVRAEEPLHRLWESMTRADIIRMRAGLTDEDQKLSNAQLAEREERSRTRGAGLGLAFGAALADATGRSIGLIPAAHGGSPLSWWDPACKNGDSSLYGAMLQRIDLAGGRLRGVLWYQGESDCLPGLAESYGGRLRVMIDALRHDLGRPELPVLAVQLGRVYAEWGPYTHPDSYQPAAWDCVREAQRLLPEHVSHCAVTSALDLGLCDTVHIDTPGLIRLGRRLARLALAYEKASTCAGTGPEIVNAVSLPPPAGNFGRVRLVCRGVAGNWPHRPIPGFEIVSAPGARPAEAEVINAQACADEPHSIDLLLSRPVDGDMRLAYGQGLHPWCGAVDEADMPLCAFSALSIKC